MTLNLLQKHDFNKLGPNRYLVGVDEAGRGSLAGPVVAAACLFKYTFFDSPKILKQTSLINDSKRLSAKARKTQFAQIESLKKQALVYFSVASASVEEIAEHNILGATRLAMSKVLEQIVTPFKELDPPHSKNQHSYRQSKSDVRILVDGLPLEPFPYAHEAIVNGDKKSLIIAMASVIAKVSRDREMCKLDQRFPDYGFAKHKGYGTSEHREAIKFLGVTEVHRRHFLRKLI